MPVIAIRALPQEEWVDVSEVIRAVSVRVADVMGIAPQRVWTTWTTIEPGNYCEGDDARGTQPNASHPPIADIVSFEGRDDETIERVLEAIADTLAERLALAQGAPFVTYTEAQKGRVYTGGSVRK